MTPHILLTAVGFRVFWQALLRARPCRGRGGGEDRFIYRPPPGARRSDYESAIGGDREHPELLPGRNEGEYRKNKPCRSKGGRGAFGPPTLNDRRGPSTGEVSNTLCNPIFCFDSFIVLFVTCLFVAHEGFPSGRVYKFCSSRFLG